MQDRSFACIPLSRSLGSYAMRDVYAAVVVLASIFVIGIAAPRAADAAACAAGDPQIACTKQGAIRGAVEGETVAFKGMPYARPAVGDLRWKPPEAPRAWEGVRD